MHPIYRIVCVAALVMLAACGQEAAEHEHGQAESPSHSGHTGPNADPSESIDEVMDDSAVEHARKHMDPQYTCPMHPQIVRDEPGSCPICGMTLVPRERGADDGNDQPPAVRLSGAMQQNLALRTGVVERGRLWRRIESLGEVQYDEDRRSMVHTRASGWVERVHVRSEGEQVEAGDLLFEFYSPELVAAQEEYRVTLRRHGADHQQTRAAADRLRLLDVPDAVIATLSQGGEVKTRMPVHAMHGGVVAVINIRHGHFLTPDQVLYELADLSQVWVEARVPQGQAEWLSDARWAEVRVDGLSDRLWEGEVDYIYPDIDPISRTLRVRMRFDNTDGQLRPNMLADVVIFGGAKSNVLSVPSEAVIRTGDGDRVVRVEDDGRFRPVPVRTGIRVGERFEIIDGLNEGDRIVTSAQFLLDSESSMRGGLNRMQGGDHANH